MKKVLVILIICLILCGCKANNKAVDLDEINSFKYDELTDLPLDVHSNEYMLIRVNDFKVLHQKDVDKKIYPASLTKIMTLDTVLHCVDDLNEKSIITPEQVYDLILEDASLAGIKTNYEYTIRDLLYALILPSGADGAIALENYFESQNMNLIDEMNKLLVSLGCDDTNFVNTTGLHDDNHYTTLNDMLKIVMDVLSYEEGRKILETRMYTMDDDKRLYSSLLRIKDEDVNVLGGKTGYTPESGQSVIVLYKANNRSYILMLANAMGDSKQKQFWHYEDAMDLMDKLY